MKVGDKHYLSMVMAPQIVQWVKRHLEESDKPNCPENMLESLMELVIVMGGTLTNANAKYFVPLLGDDQDEAVNSLRCQFIDRLEEAWLSKEMLAPPEPPPNNVIKFPGKKR